MKNTHTYTEADFRPTVKMQMPQGGRTNYCDGSITEFGRHFLDVRKKAAADANRVDEPYIDTSDWWFLATEYGPNGTYQVVHDTDGDHRMCWDDELGKPEPFLSVWKMPRTATRASLGKGYPEKIRAELEKKLSAKLVWRHYGDRDENGAQAEPGWIETVNNARASVDARSDSYANCNPLANGSQWGNWKR
jgi:hypothetical protein